ncbi:MAG: uridylate kinase [Synergistes sp.]|nr:uridylate kinase [Synergistes sp.]
MISVVKIGGAAGNDTEPLMREIAARSADGEQWIVVHGASGAMNELCAREGVEIHIVTSPSGYRSRFVGERERVLFCRAAALYGDKIAAELEKYGAKPRRFDPEKDNYNEAKRKDFLRESVNGRIRILRGNYSGTVTKIAKEPLISALDDGFVPLVPPLALDGELKISLNVDGDRLAAQIAGAVGAERLIILSNIPGLMKNADDSTSLIKNGSLADWDILEHYAYGNMKRKLTACREALELAVPHIFIADGRTESPIANALQGNSTCLAR